MPGVGGGWRLGLLNNRIGFVIIVSLLLILEIISFLPYLNILMALILTLFGFLHIFSRAVENRILVGWITLLLGISYVLTYIGFGFFDGILAFFVFGAITLRTFVLLGILVYFVFYGARREAELSKGYALRSIVAGDFRNAYARMAEGAGKAAGKGASYGWKKFSGARILGWIFIVILVYWLETSSFTSFYGVLFSSLFLLFLGLAFLFGKGRGFLIRVLGFFVILFSLPGFYSFIPGLGGIIGIYIDAVFGPFSPGSLGRYLLIAIIVFFFMFRGKTWARIEI